MTKYFWLPLFSLVIIASCAKDIIVEPPAALRGVYTAQIVVREDVGSAGGGTHSQAEAASADCCST